MGAFRKNVTFFILIVFPEHKESMALLLTLNSQGNVPGNSYRKIHKANSDLKI